MTHCAVLHVTYCLKLTTVSEMVSVPLLFPSPSSSWIPLMEKYENVFTAMLQNLKWLPVSYPSHSKTLFSDFQASLIGSVLPLQQHLLLHLSTNPLVRVLKTLQILSYPPWCSSCFFKAPMSPIPSKRKKKRSSSSLFFTVHTQVALFFCTLLVQTVESHSKWEVP